jgi:S1-C subfamily serine protease
VALLKVDLGKTTALPLRAVKPGVGAEVYAMGSPFDPSLSATLSKGIVSAYRTMDGLNFIQSDVNVMGGSSGGPLLDASGNVIGMTVSGIEAGEVPMGLNYFIPIGDTLSALGIGEARHAVVKSAAAEQAKSLPAKSVAAETSAPLTKISISGLRLFDTSLSQNMSAIQANLAAVSVGNAWGRGFFIDGNGYLLTNEHVVRSTRQVQIRMNDGKQFAGRVIAVDSRLNVALVEVTDAAGLGLPLQLIKPKLGASVYTIGSTGDDGASATGNRGVIVYQAMDDLQTIKNLMSARPAGVGSPLLDEKGNVLGIAVPGLSHNEPGDISFFVPIADALRALGISVVS